MYGIQQNHQCESHMEKGRDLKNVYERKSTNKLKEEGIFCFPRENGYCQPISDAQKPEI